MSKYRQNLELHQRKSDQTEVDNTQEKLKGDQKDHRSGDLSDRL